MNNIGTSISDLYDQNRNEIINNSNVPNFVNQDSSVSMMKRNTVDTANNEENDIKHLVNDISNNLDDEFDINDINDIYNDEIENIIKIPSDDSYIKKMFIKLYDPAILLLIYIILSQNNVRITIGKYITLINPGKDGTIGSTGIIIYGIILITLYKCCIYVMNSKI